MPTQRMPMFLPRPPSKTTAVLILVAAMVGGCAVAPPDKPAGPSPEAIQRQQRIDRAQAALGVGLKAYEAGSYEESLKSLLVAIDSGVLTLPEQLTARKHLAFIQCVNGREVVCKEEFEKAFELDPKFELLPAEQGHPTWGPIYRLVKTEIDFKRSGKPLPSAARTPSPGEKLMAEAGKAYDEGDYTKAAKLYQDALKETLAAADQAKARKFTAFCYCLSNKMSQCRAEFDKILKDDPKFELDPAEAGHPSWGPSFRAAKGKAKSQGKK
ncbi:MAG TPA: TssQ family T6SS-associated lipoprotein [Usitatibacteraceae bacterium]|nr:TssQ family T6SS-associated lipoprotein [Usitatibacteraceae bacterium]